MISQEKMQIEVYQRSASGWQYLLLDHKDDVLTLKCLNLALSMPDLYEDVVF